MGNKVRGGVGVRFKCIFTAAITSLIPPFNSNVVIMLHTIRHLGKNWNVACSGGKRKEGLMSTEPKEWKRPQTKQLPRSWKKVGAKTKQDGGGAKQAAGAQAEVGMCHRDESLFTELLQSCSLVNRMVCTSCILLCLGLVFYFFFALETLCEKTAEWNVQPWKSFGEHVLFPDRQNSGKTEPSKAL